MIVDSHCHLADDKFAGDLDDVVARAQAAGVSRALCILSADEPEEVARAAQVRAGVARGAVRGGDSSASRRLRMRAAWPMRRAVTREAAESSNAVAIGEIGLDYHYDFAPRDVQADVFAAQIARGARPATLPVVIHTREAAEDTFAVLRDAGQGRVRGVMHCFSGTADEARQALDLGILMSLSGILTFPKAESLRDVARMVPAGSPARGNRRTVSGARAAPGQKERTGVRGTHARRAGFAPSDGSMRRLAEQIAANFDAMLGPAHAPRPA